MSKAIDYRLVEEILANYDTHFVGLKEIRKTVFIFSGHGTEWVGMGKELLKVQPIFREYIQKCSEAFEPLSGWSILKELETEAESSKMDQSEIAHPCLVALEIAMVELLASLGIKPDAVIGHSVGEVAAAYAAGILDVENSFKAVYYQTEVMNLVRGKGIMLYIGLEMDDARKILDEHPGELSIAAVNSHKGTVISGTAEILEKIHQEMEEKEIFARILKMDIPFHSHTVIEYIDKTEYGIPEIQLREAKLPVYSTLRAKKSEKGDYDGPYWARHISETVLFAEAMDNIIQDGHNVFLEVGPHTVHAKDTGDSVEFNQLEEYIYAGVMQRDSNDVYELFAALAFMHTRGFPLETEGWDEDSLSIFQPILSALTDKITEDQAQKSQYTQEIRHATDENRKDIIVELIKDLLEKIAKLPKSKMGDHEAGFMSLGVNSIMSVQLKELLSKELEVRLPNTLVFDYPSINKLSVFLDDLLSERKAKPNIFRNRSKEELEEFKTYVDSLAEDKVEELLDKELNLIAEEGLKGNKKLLYLLRKQRAHKEPIAIIGYSCRLPGGANSPQEYWDLLANGIDGTSEVPTERWNNKEFFNDDKTIPGKSYVNRAGFLRGTDPYEFDPFFFKISPKEALGLDPQQRLLLEVSAEAFQNACIPLESLNGQNVGVYVGICGDDYKGAHLYSGDLKKIDAYSLLGTALSAAGGRISFTYGLQGPNMSIDTACSSSLIATHLACNSIRNGECDMAVVGGVNYLLNPVYFVYFSKLQAVSPAGHCKAFDASADGYARGEGCGIMIIKRLSQAIDDNDNILGIIKGTAVNQDGASSGFTAPNGIAQQDLIHRALRDAELEASDVDYIEAHGTGTPLGDPIEVNALGNVYGKDRDPKHPLIVGSVKSSIGHLEGAAGISGIMKILLALEHKQIPQNLHFHNPNPDIDWDSNSIEVPTRLIDWEAKGKSRIAAVSGFGFSGSNAHVIIQEGPQISKPENKVNRPVHLLNISAKDEEALRDYADSYITYLKNNSHIDIADITYTSNIGRSHYNNRLSLQGASHDEFREKLESFIKEEPAKFLKSNYIPGPKKSVTAFLFTGQGSQYFGMGKELYETNALFRAVVDQCNGILGEYLEKPLLEIMYDEAGDTDLINQTAFTQPAIFVVEYALAKLWESWGIIPDVVMGHSVGEYVAAVISGIMTLEDGLKLIAERGRLMQQLPAGGSMAAVFTSVENIEEVLKDFKGQVNVAASNSPNVNTISGDEKALEKAIVVFNEKKIKARKLVVSHAFHSHLMDPMLDEFNVFASKMSFSEPQIPLISNVTGKAIRKEDINADYWCQHVRGTVSFHPSMIELSKMGVNIFLEVGADVTLSGLGKQCLPDADALWLTSLKRKTGNWNQMLSALSDLYVEGVDIDWKGYESGYHRRKAVIPSYPYQKKRFYLNSYNFPADGIENVGIPGAKNIHHYLGMRIPSPLDDKIYINQFTQEEQSLIEDHVIFDMPLAAGTTYIEMGYAAAKDVLGNDPVVIENIKIQEGLILNKDDSRQVESVLSKESDSSYLFSVHSMDSAENNNEEVWLDHSEMIISKSGLNSSNGTPENFDPETLKNRMSGGMSGEEYYQTAEEAGYKYSNRFQGINNLWWSETESLSEVHSGDLDYTDEFFVHPGVLDSCFQIFVATYVGNMKPQDQDYVLVLTGVDKLTIYEPLHGNLWVHFKDYQFDDNMRKGNQIVQNSEGRIVAKIEGITARKVNRSMIQRSSQKGLSHLMHKVDWRPSELAASESRISDKNIVIFANDSEFSNLLSGELGASNNCIIVRPSMAYANKLRSFDLDPTEADHFKKLLKDITERHNAIDSILFLWNLETGDSIKDVNQLKKLQKNSLGSLLYLSQAMISQNINPNLYILTDHAYKVLAEDEIIHFSQSSVSGFRNVLALENPSIRSLHIDLSSKDKTELNLLIKELAAEDSQSQIAYRGGQRYVAKFAPYLDKSEVSSLLSIPNEDNFFLDTSGRGLLENLRLQATPLEMPASNEVQIRVHSTGLNFRDVLNALGQYPGDAGSFGMECSGEVIAIGEDVSKFKIGDRVMANAQGSFRKIINYPEEYIVKVPDNISYEDAATIPGAFLTAYYGLSRLGGIKKGDKVLIHAGAGGVGMAAVQIALAKGAEVFSTAGNDEKRAFLKEMGVHHVMNSRTLDFAEEINKITKKRGVDLILNSLAGDFIDKNFSVIAENGRFIEMGKKGIWTEEQVKKFNSSLTYRAFDLASDGKKDPSLIEHMFAELMAEFTAGKLKPLPKTVFDLENTVDAFRFMAQAKHTGKIVISQAKQIMAEQFSQKGFSDDGTYIITGGLGALGLVFAWWLSEKGARNLALFGRSAPKPHAEKLIAELKEAGTNVQVFAADAADENSLKLVFKEINERMPTIKGIIHAAGILDDGMLLQQDWERFEKVMAAKVYGGWNLHKLTADMDLDLFILFSSVSAIFGNRGQANYASANAFLDGLAHYRKSLGLAATSINWGPWGEAGMAAEDTKRAALIAKQGFYNIKTEDGLTTLENAIIDNATQMAVVELNAATFLDNLPELQQIGFFEDLQKGQAKQKAPKKKAAAKKIDFFKKLKLSPEDQKIDVLIELVRNTVASVLNFNAEEINVNKQFRELGFDSLTNAEFINLLDKTLKLSLSQALYLEYPTVFQMSEHILKMPGLIEKMEAAEIDEGEAELVVTAASTKPEVQDKAKAATTEVKEKAKASIASVEEKTEQLKKEILGNGKTEKDGEKKGFFARLIERLTDIEE